MNLISFRSMLKMAKVANKQRTCVLFLNTPITNFGVQPAPSLVKKNIYNFGEKK